MLTGLLISHPVPKGLDVLPEKLEEVMMEKMVWACLLKLLQKKNRMVLQQHYSFT